MHLLHACVIKAEWFSERFSTPDLTYVSSLGMLHVGDAILIPLSWLLPPYWAHAWSSAFILIAFGLGLLQLMRAYGRVHPLAFVLVLPFIHSFLLMMGFFTFLLTLGAAFAFAAYWARSEVVTIKRLLILLVGAVVCASMHRSGAPVLLSLVFIHEGVLFLRSRPAFRVRWASVSGYALLALALMGTAVVVVLIVRIITGVTHFEQAEARAPLIDLLRMRPLLLVDSVAERPFLLGFGGLILVLLAIAGWTRWRRDRAWASGDALWISGASALLLSFCVRGPYADLIYLVERLQFIGLLLLCAWLVIQWKPTLVLKTLALCLFVVQIARIVHLERRLLPLRPSYEAAMEVPSHLPPHEVVLPVLRENNWILDHLGAFVSIDYDGVFFSPHEHLGSHIKPPVSRDMFRYGWGNRNNVKWLREHLESRKAPIIDHLVVFGRGAPRDPADSVILSLRAAYFTKQWENAYAEVWVRK